MSAAELSSPLDFPPRTWRGWWLAWPKWFRIGCYAALGLVFLNIAVVVRIYVGLIEPPEIQALRRPGVHVLFASDSRGQPFRGFNRLMDGLKGISCRDVVTIRLDREGTDADLELIGRSFPELRGLYLVDADVSVAGLGHLRSCRQLLELDLRGTDVDDSAASILAELPKLHRLHLAETRVGDATLAALQHSSQLSWLDVSYTDVSPGAIQAARAKMNRTSTIATEHDRVSSGVLGSLRWSDGTRAARFPGRFELRVTGPFVDGRSTGSFAHMSTGLRRQSMWWDTKQFQGRTDGEYHFTAKLNGIESAPAVVTIEAGLPSVSRIEFLMPCTKAEALASEQK